MSVARLTDIFLGKGRGWGEGAGGPSRGLGSGRKRQACYFGLYPLGHLRGSDREGAAKPATGLWLLLCGIPVDGIRCALTRRADATSKEEGIPLEWGSGLGCSRRGTAVHGKSGALEMEASVTTSRSVRQEIVSFYLFSSLQDFMIIQIVHFSYNLHNKIPLTVP